MTIAIIGGVILVGMAYSQDSTATVQVVTAIITIRGIGWIAKKITSSVNFDHSQIIDMASWCLAGVGIIKLIVLAKMQVDPLLNKMAEHSVNISKIFELADKITFWN